MKAASPFAVREPFVPRDSIVRRIWGDGDTILFIFAGAAAEFALNKAVDWLFFTGRLPADPLGRLFSTVGYARRIVFSDRAGAHAAIDSMAAVHAGVEAKRGRSIPDWAYRDVLFMLIDYSERAYGTLYRPLSPAERAEVFGVFYRVGDRMGLRDLPPDRAAYDRMRVDHLATDLAYSAYTDRLFRRYREELSPLQYFLLLEAQRLVVPRRVADMLRYRRPSLIGPLITAYRLLRTLGVHRTVRDRLLPGEYRQRINELDAPPSAPMPT